MSSSSSARRVMAASSRRKAPRRMRVWMAAVSRWRLQATRTLSKTESEPKSRMFWKVRAMPHSTISLTRRPASGRPLNRTAPEVGW
jgi:hypothetical protein